MLLLHSTVPEEELVHSFMYGLKTPLKGFVKAKVISQSVTKLTEFMQIAMQFEENVRTSMTPLQNKTH